MLSVGPAERPELPFWTTHIPQFDAPPADPAATVTTATMRKTKKGVVFKADDVEKKRAEMLEEQLAAERKKEKSAAKKRREKWRKERSKQRQDKEKKNKLEDRQKRDAEKVRRAAKVERKRAERKENAGERCEEAGRRLLGEQKEPQAQEFEDEAAASTNTAGVLQPELGQSGDGRGGQGISILSGFWSWSDLLCVSSSSWRGCASGGSSFHGSRFGLWRERA